MNIKSLKILEYTFDDDNPYSFDADPPKSLRSISGQIEAALKSNFEMENVLVRGIQSRHYEQSRDELIERIFKSSIDIHRRETTAEDTVYAAEFADGVIENILEGFHTYKPKSDERPQCPVDVWVIMNTDDYENIEYTHNRHKILARDKWRIKSNFTNGIRGVLILN